MFEPLALPEKTDDGYWVVTVQSDEYLQLHVDGGLYEGIDCNGSTAYFDTESNAFSAACKYYSSYKVLYPFFNEYSRAVSNAYKKHLNKKEINNIVESQIMEFE